MMRLYTTIILLTVYLSSFGQETKFVLKDGGGFKEEYYVLKDDKKIRHGTYVKYRQPLGQVIIIESGKYANGEKDGQWETFYNLYPRNTWNAIKEKGNYVNGKKNSVWLYYYLDTTNVTNIEKFGQKSKTDLLNVNIDQSNIKLKLAGMYLNDKRVGEWASWDYKGILSQMYNFSTGALLYDVSVKDSLEYNRNRKPLYFGGESSLFEFLAQNITVPETLSKVKGDTVYAIAKFTIDEQGKTKHISVTSNSDNKSLKEEFTKLITMTDLNWIPGLKDGAKAEYPFMIRYDIVSTKPKRNSKIWEIMFRPLE